MSWKVLLDCEVAARDVLSGHFFELGALGVEERETGLCAFFVADTDTQALRVQVEDYLRELEHFPEAAPGAWSLSIEDLPDQDWQANWKAQWNQQHIGKRLSICPSWIEPQDADTRLVLRLDPGSAFGTGTHESTLLLLEWLDGMGDLSGQHVLDAGCGTGVLALAALKLGAAFTLGIDIDAEAVRVSRENAKDNMLGTGSYFRQGDPRELGPEYHFELVLANIQRSVIEEYFHDLLRVTKPGGLLLLAGLLETEEDAIRTLAQEWKLPDPEVRHKGEWIAMGLTRPLECEV
jgi:ribosomal protein L11 methyltransferase